MKIAMSSGHGKYIRGAAGSPIPPCVDEVDEARKIVDSTAVELRKLGVEVLTFHDNTSHDQSTNLNTIVNWHNKQSRDFDVSVHLNCYDKSAHGVEVLWKTQEELAAKVSAAIAKIGFNNRGAKYRSDLKFLNSTNKPAVLVETIFCDNKGDCDTYHAKFEQVCRAIAESLSGKQAQPRPTPPQPSRPEPPTRPAAPTPPEQPAKQPTLSEGSEGPAVIGLQETLGVQPADGDFGNITATQVEAFQAACGLSPDGVVGPNTWEEIDDLEDRLADAISGLPEEATGLDKEIVALAKNSSLQEYEWPDRGISPPGYLSGMCLCYAVALRELAGQELHAVAMAQALGSSSVDVLKWYEAELKKIGCKLDAAQDRLRSLFVVMIGLSMRESSGRYCEGRDMSADNVTADTCEAGLMQTSWNIKTADPSLSGLLVDYWANPNGFLEEFQENVDPTAENLNCYGTGEGAKYQWLAKYCPLFAVMVSGVGLRHRKDHWGPIVRREVTLRKEADDLLKDIQALLEASGAVA